MRLYATTTSERATKGQGGNKYILIEIKDDNKEVIATIRFDIKEDEIGEIITYQSWFSERIYDLTKGKREYCFQCSPDGKYTIKDVCEICKGINKRADKEQKGKSQKGERCKVCEDYRETDNNSRCSDCAKAYKEQF